jgi:hypothetical protein
MEDKSKIIELAKKLKALAEQGIGGEKDIEILNAIAIRFPYALETVEAVFDKVKSYDKTIKILNISIKDPLEIADLTAEELIKFKS